MTKANMLQAALSQSGGRKAELQEKPAPQKEPEANGTASRPPSREGKINVSAYLDPAYKRSLRMVQAVTNKKIEPLLAEALNDLFAKYDVPQVRMD